MKANESYNGTAVTGPALGLLGAMLVLMGVLVVFTVYDIQRQKAAGTQLLMEKGSAVIRSVEAGTRTHMAFSRWGREHLERLLSETASQSDIVYLAVLNADGSLLAASDDRGAAVLHLDGIDFPAVAAAATPLFRRETTADGRPVFEVYRRFVPTTSPRGRRMMMGRSRGMMSHMSGDDPPHHMPETPPDMVIFAGLDMTPIVKARAADLRRSLLMAAVLLLAGVAGFYLVHVLQNYRAARSAVSRLESFSASLADNLPVGLVTTDDALRISRLNPAAESILGLDAATAAGRPAVELLPPALCGLLETVGANDNLEREVDLPRGEGASLPLAVSVTAWHGDGGRFLGRILLVKDLTEVAALRREIAKSQRLASLGSLAAGVAHEIRNPLSSIKGFATYFKERYKDVDADRETAEIMVGEVDRMNRVVGQLLEFSRPVDIALAPVAVRPLLERSLAAVRPRLEEKQVAVDLTAAETLPKVPMDADRVQQVIINLLLNAAEAIPAAGGRVTVTADTGGSDWMHIAVSDNGRGIPPDQLPHVFDPYFTTKSTGTGLGLAIVHNIAEAHGGGIDARSGDGATTFTLRLPLAGRKPS